MAKRQHIKSLSANPTHCKQLYCLMPFHIIMEDVPFIWLECPVLKWVAFMLAIPYKQPCSEQHQYPHQHQHQNPKQRLKNKQQRAVSIGQQSAHERGEPGNAFEH